MSEFLQDDLSNPRGYTKKAGRPGPVLVPLALTAEGQVVFGTNRIPLTTLQKLKWMHYDDEVERQRRLLADTALAQLALEHPRWVENAVKRVGRGVRDFWNTIKTGMGEQALTDLSGKDASNRIYGATSFGRRDQGVDTLAVSQGTGGAMAKAKVELWFAELDKTPLDVPKLMSLFDYFYCKVLVPNTPKDPPEPRFPMSPEWMRARLKIKDWRPIWYDDSKARGRIDNKDARTTSYPGLLSGSFTIPLVAPLERCGLDLSNMLLDTRKRGWEMFSIKAGGMNDLFRQSLSEHNLPFSASASGTTSTLFLSAEAFAAISACPSEEQKQYLLACVIYLVAGGMHTCHEVFWTGRQAGIQVADGKYIDALPRSFTATTFYEKWATEFWEIVRPDRPKVR